MEFLQKFVIVLFTAFQFYYAFLTYYYNIISLWGLKGYKEEDEDLEPSKRFALVVCAHNESAVIEGIVDNLQKLDYPKELYDVYVLADNCTDNTAELSRKGGALVYERFNDKLRGKGYALKEFFEEFLFKTGDKYDAVAVFDADNLVSTNYLKKMNNELLRGNKVMQCYLDTKNPDDTWITLSYALSYWIMNRAFQLARKRLGLSAAIGGTGFCISMDVLREIGWDALSLTEDLEFTMKCIMRGIKVVWVHTAKIYDEKPLEFKASYRQRLRWLQGHWDCAYKYTIPLLKDFIKTRRWMSLDGIIYLLQPSRIAIHSFVLVAFVLKLFIPNFWFSKLLLPAWLWGITLFIGYGIPILILINERVGLNRILGLFSYFIFGLSWYPLAIQGWFKRKNKEWTHTKHTRSVKIDELKDITQNQ